MATDNITGIVYSIEENSEGIEYVTLRWQDADWWVLPTSRPMRKWFRDHLGDTVTVTGRFGRTGYLKPTKTRLGIDPQAMNLRLPI